MLKFIKIYTPKLYVVPFTVKRKVNKGKDAELIHNCLKLMVIHTIVL